MKTLSRVYKVMSKISDSVEKVINLILVILVLSCALDLFLQVLYRFVLIHYFDFSMTWTTEYAQDAIIWITYLAIGICYKENSMSSVNFIYDRLSKKGKLVLYLITRIIVLVFLSIGINYGWKAIISVSNWTSTSLHIPGWALYGFPFLGCLFMLYEAITEIIGVLSNELEPFVGKKLKETEGEELTEEDKKLLDSLQQGMKKD